MSSFDFVEKVMTIGGTGNDVPTLQFYKKGFNLGGSVTPDWKDIILHGNTALTLVNAKANSLEYLKLFGDTELLPETYLDTVTLSGGLEQNGTPTADQPIDIISNNGAIKVSPNLLNMNDLYGNYLLTDGGQVGSTAENFFLTNFIRVFPNTTYTFSFISGTNVQYRRVCGYSSADQNTFTQLLIKKARPTAENERFDLTFTTDANTNYIRISSCIGDTNTQVAQGATAPTYRPYKQIYTDGITETITDNVGNVATCQMLLKIFKSIDTQEILSGTVTRDIDITVLDGSEEYTKLTNRNVYSSSLICPNITRAKSVMYCTHFVYDSSNTTEIPDGAIGTANTSTNVFIRNDNCTSVAEYQQWLKDQYTAGTPVIIVYQRQTETTETVTGQVLTKSPVTQTAGAISGLTITTTESAHTVPTPTNPLPINCNNGVVKVSPNLLNENTIVEGFYLADNGTITSYSNTFYSDYIIVKPLTTYIFSETNPLIIGYLRIHDYNTNKELISMIGKSNRGDTSTTFTTGATSKYIRVSGSSGDNIQVTEGSSIIPYLTYGEIYTKGTVETVTDSVGNTANAERLLAVDTYKDTQEVISGGVTRNVGIKVLNGTETWQTDAYDGYRRFYITNFAKRGYSIVFCTHYDSDISVISKYNNCYISSTGTFAIAISAEQTFTTVEQWKQYLSDQYANGTPVIVVYPLATPTTQTVTAQPMNIQEGTNIVEITQASMDGLELEVKYKAGVAVTITEVQNAQLDNNVEVTIQ